MEEIKEYLKNNLKIVIESEPHKDFYHTSSTNSTIKVKLILENEIINEYETSIF